MKFTMKKLGKAVLTAALVGVVAAVLAGCGKQSDSAAGGGDGQKKVVNVAFTNYYVPYDFVNDKGEPDGFEVAVMQEVAKKLPQYTWKFTRPRTMTCSSASNQVNIPSVPKASGKRLPGKRNISSRKTTSVPVSSA